MDICKNAVWPKISIITASFNSEKYIEDTIKSVLMQTYENIEYIIIDGGSKDRTLEIIDKYSGKLDYISSEPDSGIYEAFNKGVKISSGDIIYFLNSDDYLYDEDSIKSIAKVFAGNRNLSIVYGNILITDDSCRHKYIFGRDMGLEDFKKGCMPPHPGTFVKRELFALHGFFNLGYRISSDFEFMLKCFLYDNGGIFYINRTIAVFREGGKSSDYRYGKIMENETREIISRYFGETGDMSRTESNTDSNALCRFWLESLLLKEKGITGMLKDNNVKDVAIFGTRKIALYLYNDLKKEKFNVVRFLDNNANMHGRKIFDIAVESPDWLRKNDVDAVIVSIESNDDTGVIKQLNGITAGRALVVSWKELVLNQII